MPPTAEIPNYDTWYAARQEEVKKAQAARVHLMQPTIHLQIQVRKIVATGYDDARGAAWQALTDGECAKMLANIGIYSVHQFWDAARVAKEVDGTYTVTLP